MLLWKTYCYLISTFYLLNTCSPSSLFWKGFRPLLALVETFTFSTVRKPQLSCLNHLHPSLQFCSYCSKYLSYMFLPGMIQIWHLIFNFGFSLKTKVHMAWADSRNKFFLSQFQQCLDFLFFFYLVLTPLFTGIFQEQRLYFEIFAAA